MMKLFNKKIIFLILILCLSSCKGIQFENKKVTEVPELSYGEAMVFVTMEKNKYDLNFGSEIWDLKSGNGKLYFRDYLVNNVKNFVEKLMILELAGRELNVSMNTSDIKEVELAADEYMSGLTEEDLAYMNCEREDVVKAFYDYHMARLTIDNISKGAISELSVSEAKVIKVQYMAFNDKETAEETVDLVNVKNANFMYYARSRSVDKVYELVVKKGSDFSTRFPEIFYLTKGELSSILKSENKYYLFKCIDDYLVEETENRRIELLAALKNDEFNKYFKKYETKYKLKSNSRYWQEIDLKNGMGCTVNNFEEVYYKHFPKSIR